MEMRVQLRDAFCIFCAIGTNYREWGFTEVLQCAPLAQELGIKGDCKIPAGLFATDGFDQIPALLGGPRQDCRSNDDDGPDVELAKRKRNPGADRLHG